MPVPKPKSGESETEYVSRCVERLVKLDPERSRKQIIAICYSTWRRAQLQEITSDDVVKRDAKPILPGRYLVEPHAEYIWKGKKTLIVSTVKDEKYLDQPVYLIEDQKVYGIIKIKQPKGPYSADKVRTQLRHRHQITDAEWESWAKTNPSWNDKVYVYEFDRVKMFDQPVYYEPSPGTVRWVSEVELESEIEVISYEQTKSDVRRIDFSKMTKDEFRAYVKRLEDKALIHWHSKTHAWYAKIKENIKFTKEQIVMMHTEIVKELFRRGYSHFLRDELDRVKLEIEDTDLAPIRSSGVETAETKLTWKDIVPKLKPFYLMRPLIYIVGGAVTRDKQGGTKGDIDWVIDYPKRIEERDHPLEFRLGRQFPSDIAERFTFNYSRLAGPFTSYVPAYDLLMIPSKWKNVVRMEQVLAKLEEFFDEEEMFASLQAGEAMTQARRAKETDTVKPMEFVLPAKPVIGHEAGERYTIESIVDMIDEYPVFCEKKVDGNWLQLMKDGDKVLIRTERGFDVTNRLPETVKEFKTWPIKTLTIMSDSEKWTADGKYVGRELVAAYLHAKTPPDDTGIVHNVVDVIYFDKDIHKEPYSERRKYLQKLPIKQSTGEAPSIKTSFNLMPTTLCKNEKELKSAITKAIHMKASEGTIVKQADSTFLLGGSQWDWHKFKKTGDVTVVVLKPLETKVSGVIRYRVGVKIPPGWKVTRTMKVCDTEYMDVGKTLSLKKRYNIGDVILVNYEEMFYYTDPETNEKQVVLYVPNIIAGEKPKRDTPESAEEAIEEADRIGLLIKKEGRLTYVRQSMEAAGLW